MTSVGSQGVRGRERGSPILENIGALYRVGGNCQATDAAYIGTQFGGHGCVRTTDRYAGTNEKAGAFPNLENALGLAEDHQKAVAIPRGDCNKK